MSGEVNKPQQLPPPTLGQVFYNTANKFAMIGAMTNASVFGGCYIGYPIPGCFPIAGLDADDIAIRMMPPPPAQNTIFNGTTTGSAFSDIPNFGNWFNTTPTTNPTGTTAASDGTKPSYLSAEQKQKTTNTSEVFSRIDSAKWAEMREKEAEIAKKHDEWSKATGTEKNAKAKELRALHQEYDKLDRELGGGSALSHRYGITDRTFYTNIDDETELSSIKDINGEIEQAQKELADTDEDYGKLLAEKDSAAAQLRKELGVFVTITDDMAKERMSAESREALEALTKQRAEKISEIESKIKELNELIKKAGKDKDKYSITGDKIEDAKKDENEDDKKTEYLVKDGKLVDKDGKPAKGEVEFNGKKYRDGVAVEEQKAPASEKTEENKPAQYTLKDGKLVDKDGKPAKGEVEFNGKKYRDGVEVKQPAETKPAETKPAEQKPAPAPAPAEPKPAEAKPAEVKPAETPAANAETAKDLKMLAQGIQVPGVGNAFLSALVNCDFKENKYYVRGTNDKVNDVLGGRWVIAGELYSGPSLNPDNKEKAIYKEGLLVAYKDDAATYIYKDGALVDQNDSKKTFSGFVDCILYKDGKPFTGEQNGIKYENGTPQKIWSSLLDLPVQKPTWSTPGTPTWAPPGTLLKLPNGTTIQF